MENLAHSFILAMRVICDLVLAEGLLANALLLFVRAEELGSEKALFRFL
jgi:hypothetical protein